MSPEAVPGWLRDFTGLAVATVTPFGDDGRFAADLVPGYVRFLRHAGARALMVGGTTGEFVAMSPDERAEAIAAFVAAAGDLPVIAHVGSVAPAQARWLAQRAVAAGASAVAAIVPYFYPTSPAAIVAQLADLADLAGGTGGLPLLAYCHPATGNVLRAEQFAPLLDHPYVAGAKLSLARFEDIEPWLPLLDRAVLFCGNDSLLRPFFAAGGRAVVSGNAAAFPDVIRAAVDTLLAGPDDRIDRVCEALEQMVVATRAGAPDRLKQLLRARGIDAGRARVRTWIPPDDTPYRPPAALAALMS